MSMQLHPLPDLQQDSNSTCASCVQGFSDMDGVDLFGLICIASLVLCMPLALYFEGRLWPQALRTVHEVGGFAMLFSQFLASGVLYFLASQCSYAVLAHGLTPERFVLFNTLKRAVVVAVSVLVSTNPVTPLGWLSICMVLSASYAYATAKAELS
jgi:Triose-phosphate Transporter family